MPNFDARMSSAGTAVVVVRCPQCRCLAEHRLSNVAVGTDVSCSACGRRIVVTPDNWVWIKSRADVLEARAPQTSRSPAAAERR